MKKKKHLADLMEEDLLETIQQRINELNAELKLLYARHGPLYVQPGSWNLRCKLRRDLEREQERLRREQERRGREEQERREHEARDNLLECAKNRDDFLRSKWLYGKWNTPDGVLVFVDTELDSGFYGQNDKTPFLCFIKSLEEDGNRLQFEYYGESVYATVDGEQLIWDDGATYIRHDEQKEEQRIQREQLQDQLAGEWMTFNVRIHLFSGSLTLTWMVFLSTSMTTTRGFWHGWMVLS